MNCSNCGAMLEEDAAFCPECGTPVKMKPAGQIFCPECGTPANPGDAFCGECGHPFDAPAFEYEETETQETDGGTRKRPGIFSFKNNGMQNGLPRPAMIGIIAAAVVVLIFLFTRTDLYRRTLMSPAKYWRYTEKQALKNTLPAALSFYDETAGSLSDDNNAATVEVNMKIEDAGSDLLWDLEDSAGADLTWFNSASIRTSAEKKKDILATETTLQLNDQDIITADITMDLEEEMLYMLIPELTEKALLESELDSSTTRSLTRALDNEELMEAVEALPSSAELKKLVNRYSKIVLNNVKDVKKESDEVSKKGIEEKCTELTVKIDEDAEYDILKAIAKEASKDKDLQKLAEKLDVEDELEDMIEEIEDLEKDRFYYGTDIKMKVYVDHKGNIIGRKIEVAGEDVAEYYFLTKGKNTALDCVIGEDEVTLSGKGTRSGSKYSGTYTLMTDDNEELEIEIEDLDLLKLKKGYINGKFTFPVDSVMNQYQYTSYGRLLSDGDMAVSMDITSGKKELAADISLLLDGEPLATFGCSVSGSGSAKTLKPSSYEEYDLSDNSDMEDYIDEAEDGFEKVMDNLSKCGFPEEYIEELEDALY